MNLRIKICCITTRAEAALAVRCGADAVGLVSAMPSGPGVISEQTIADIAVSVPSGIATFLLTSEQKVAAIVAQQRHCRTNTIQICDALEPEGYAVLRAELPAVKLVQVIHVSGQEAMADARRVASEVDAILLDSGNQKLTVKELGGTGRTHDWRVSQEIVAAVKVPVYLAGGLNAANVGAAITKVRPYGVDICSGVRTNGKLHEEKLRQFIASARQAAATCAAATHCPE